jgi:hypothetical protein
MRTLISSMFAYLHFIDCVMFAIYRPLYKYTTSVPINKAYKFSQKSNLTKFDQL